MKKTIILGILLLIPLTTNQIIFGETFVELNNDDDRATNMYFSIKPLDNWMYKEYSNSYAAQLIGFGPLNTVDLIPIELAEDNDNKTLLAGQITQDQSYSFKNAPLSMYIKNKIEQYTVNGYYSIISKNNNTIIDGQPAIKLTAVVIDKPGIPNKQVIGWKYLEYLTQYDNSWYSINLFGDPQSFEKYVPEFEQMVKTVKWVNNNS